MPLSGASPRSAASTIADLNLRNRMGQGVDAIADSANKVISGVVDSSFGILRSFLPNQGSEGHVSRRNSLGISRPPTPGALGSVPKPGFGGLLRRDKDGATSPGAEGSMPSGGGFSIANIAASLPISVRGRASNGEEAGQQLMSVSRASSVRSRASVGSRGSTRGDFKLRIAGESSDEDSDDESEESDEEESDGEGNESAEDGADYVGADAKSVGSTRSITSFESMLAAEKAKAKADRRKKKVTNSTTPPTVTTTAAEKEATERTARKSLSDRLARVSSTALSARAMVRLPLIFYVYIY